MTQTESLRLRRRQEQIVLDQLRRHAARLATSFELPLRVVQAESPRVKRRYGICYEDGTIKIRLRSVRTGEFLRESSLVDTLCHELAHLRHFDHGRSFQRLYERILGYARRSGIYRPGMPSRWRFEEGEREPQTQSEVGGLPSGTHGLRPCGRSARGGGAPVQLELF